VSYGFIDSAYIMNAISALTCHKNYEEWSEWEWKSITEVTEALVFNHHLRIAPGPSPSKLEAAQSELYVCYDLACKQLGRIIEDIYPIDVKIQELAKKVFNEWLLKNVEDARGAITETKQEKSYPHWEQLAIEHAWVDHSYRLKGLFNAEMIDELAFILEAPPNDLRSLWKKTTDLQQVKNWSQGRNLDSDFELAKDAYIASAILRGRFHDFVASRMQWQIMHHPIRRHILVSLSQGVGYRIPETGEYLAQIIANSAMEEQKPKDRILCWTENIRTVQEAYCQDIIPEILNEELKQEKARDLAIKTAKKLQIRVYPHSLENQLELAVMSGITLGTSLLGLWIVFPWGALAGGVIGVGAWISGMSKPWGRRTAQAMKLTTGHLRELVTSKPGRIVRSWNDTKKRGKAC